MSSEDKVLTPKFRVSFPNVFEPTSFNGSKPNYNIQMIFDEDADLSEMEALVQKKAKEKFPKGKPKKFKNPLRDGDEKDMEMYKGKIFAGAKSLYKPGLVDKNLKDIINPEEFYPGCYARATLTAYGYDQAGNQGVAFGLQNIQKLGDGDRFGGKAEAANDFDVVADGEEETTQDGWNKDSETANEWED